MLSDSELQKKVNALTNKLNAGLFQEVINEAQILLSKENIKFYLI